MSRVRRQSGFSLLELLLGLTATLMLLGMLTQATRSSSQLASTTLTMGRLEEAASQASLLMNSELRWAQPDTLLITTENGSDRVDFVVAEGFDGTNILWSTPIVFRYEPSAGDGNGNGVADEGDLVRIQGDTRRVLCRNVDFGGVSVVQDAHNVQIRIDAFARSRDGRIVSSGCESSVTLVNHAP